MKFFRKFFISVFIFLLFSVGGSYLFVRHFDLNKYIPVLADMIKKETGRTLVIANAESKISLIPTIVLEDVSFSNALWAKTPNMFEAEKIELKIAILPLMDRRFVIKNLVVDNPNIYLETNDSGEENWDFNKKNKKTSNFEIISSAKAEAKASEIPDFSLGEIDINNAFVMFNDEVVNVDNFDFSIPNKDDNINASFNLVYNDIKIAGTSVLGSVNNLFDHTIYYPFNFNAKVDGLKLELNGGVAQLFNGNPQVETSLNVYNPNGNLGFFEATLNSQIKASKTNVDADISLFNVAGNIMKGRVNANLEGEVFVDANLNSELINLQNFKKEESAGVNLPSIISSANAASFMPATKIDYNLLKNIDAKLTATIKEFVIDEEHIATNVDMMANLNNGILNINPATFNFGDGDIAVSAIVDAQKQTINADVNSKGLSIQKFSSEFVVKNKDDFGVLSGGKLDIKAKLNSSGSTYKEVVENLDGRLTAIVGKSVLQTGKSNLLSGIAGTVINALKLKDSATTDVDLTCAVLRADFDKGMVKIPDGIAIQSDDISLVANGNVSLKTDVVNIDIHPYSSQILNPSLAGSVGGFLKVVGTIDNPVIRIDEKQALKTLVGVLTTGGTSYVGSKVVLDSGLSPCYTALKGTGLEDRFSKPSVANETYDKTAQEIDENYQKLENAVKEVGNTAKELLKGLF
ncbi:MAG: AsmA family protein [Alphaproteobacteria bacterium]